MNVYTVLVLEHGYDPLEAIIPAFRKYPALSEHSLFLTFDGVIYAHLVLKYLRTAHEVREVVIS